MVSSQGLYFEVDFGIQGMNPEFTTFYKCTDVSVCPNFLGMREVKLEKYSVYLPSPALLGFLLLVPGPPNASVISKWTQVLQR